jgi:predicted transcriptional regulator
MTYKKIVQFLTSGSKSLVDIASHLKMKSSGGFKDYLTNLELAGFISAEAFPGRKNSKIIKYRISDPFISFYFKYMQSNRTALIKKPISRFFQNHVQPNYNVWLGLAFENFCSNNVKALTWEYGLQRAAINLWANGY